MNMNNWSKIGKIFDPIGRSDWMNSHAQVPFTLDLGDFIRVYFSTREAADKNNLFRSFSGYVDLNKNNLKEIINVSKTPILELGSAGDFDEFGTMAGSIVKHNNQFYLYYCGWTRCTSVPYNWAIGLATSDDGSKFKKYSQGPIVGASPNEPFLQACPIVYKLSQNDWHMFYLSGIKWLEFNNKYESQYLLFHATSKNGIDWVRDSEPIIKTTVENECQTSASIIKNGDNFHMFFSYRFGQQFREDIKKGYRLGYAYSKDLKNWIRDDSKISISISQEGWDSRMIAYPHIFRNQNKYYMLYCGNNFGKEGFGLAKLNT